MNIPRTSSGSPNSHYLTWHKRLTLVGAALVCHACPNDPHCGDGYVDAAEECDDGNPNDGDGCGAQCQIEAGYQCQTAGVACEGELTAVCGDGIVTGGEQCDDGADNLTGYNRCAPNCTLGPFCGDGVVDALHEECDDGINDGTESDCMPGCVQR
jgi:cysteine-rich repeat protein